MMFKLPKVSSMDIADLVKSNPKNTDDAFCKYFQVIVNITVVANNLITETSLSLDFDYFMRSL